MQERIVNRLKGVQPSCPQTYRDIVIFPLTDGDGDAVNYITLSEALEGRFLTVTEVSQGGSVPELKVANSGEMSVLLLDGEELAGAKQNRVLNTTVLVPGKQTLVIPVSCTEQGRWAYATEAFYDSGTVMTRGIRARKAVSVSESLASSASFKSDQGAVWTGIEELRENAGTHSPTEAMRDVFESQSEALGDASKAFPLVPGQVGILAVIGGKAAGFDILSRPAAYAILHGKLVKSYVMDALLRGKIASGESSGALKAGYDFIYRAVGCEEKAFKSVGLGDDYRFKGDHIAGSALVHSDTVIHTAFFHLDQATADGRMSGINRRRAYRE